MKARRPAKHTIFDTPVFSAFVRILALLFLRIIGWQSVGRLPAAAKLVLVAAPHTSNLDFPIMMAIAFRLRARISWIGKDSLFPWWMRPMTRYLGGIPVDRSKPGGMVSETIREFEATDRLVIVVPPEGTRGKTRGWKTGFYHIADGAGVPIACGFLDYGTKTGGVGPTITPTGDLEADLDQIREFYTDIRGRYPERTAPIAFMKFESVGNDNEPADLATAASSTRTE